MPKKLLFVAICLCLAAVGPSEAARTISHCATNTMTIVSSDNDNISSSFTAFQPIPDMTVTINVGGTKPGCVIVEFQANATAPDANDNMILLDARLDNDNTNNYLGTPEPPWVANDNHYGTTRGMRFIWRAVAPGTHTIKLYYRPYEAFNVFMGLPTMIVHYTK